jgi:hypothetical protein
MMIAAMSVRSPVMMSSNFDFKKKAKTDQKKLDKLSKKFETLKKESDERRAKLDKHVDHLVKHFDEIARNDVEKLQKLFADDGEKSIDLDDLEVVEVVDDGDVVTFKDSI